MGRYKPSNSLNGPKQGSAATLEWGIAPEEQEATPTCSSTSLLGSLRVPISIPIISPLYTVACFLLLWVTGSWAGMECGIAGSEWKLC